MRKVQKFICQYYLKSWCRNKGNSETPARSTMLSFITINSLILISSNVSTNLNVQCTYSSWFAHFFTPLYKHACLPVCGMKGPVYVSSDCSWDIKAFKPFVTACLLMGAVELTLARSPPSVSASRCGRVHKTGHTLSSWCL